MVKRMSGSLTGGTGDVNPQYLTMALAQTAANNTITLAVPLPIQRLPTSGKAQVLEVLKVFFRSGDMVNVDAGMNVALSTRNHGTTAASFGDPDVFAFMTWSHEISNLFLGGVRVLISLLKAQQAPSNALRPLSTT